MVLFTSDNLVIINFERAVRLVTEKFISLYCIVEINTTTYYVTVVGLTLKRANFYWIEDNGHLRLRFGVDVAHYIQRPHT